MERPVENEPALTINSIPESDLKDFLELTHREFDNHRGLALSHLLFCYREFYLKEGKKNEDKLKELEERVVTLEKELPKNEQPQFFGKKGGD